MQPVDLLIADIDWLITGDSKRRIIRDAAIAINDGKVVAVDKSKEILTGYSSRKVIDGRRTVAPSGYRRHLRIAVVHVFTIHGHPKANKAYAWSSPIEGSDKRRFFAVLHVPPVTSPVEAVRAAIVAERRASNV